MFEIPERSEWLQADIAGLRRLLSRADGYISRRDMLLINSRLRDVLHKAIDTDERDLALYLLTGLPAEFRMAEGQAEVRRALFERALLAGSFDVLSLLIEHASDNLVINYNFQIAHLFLSSCFGDSELEELHELVSGTDDGSLVWFLAEAVARGCTLPMSVVLAIEERLDSALLDVINATS